MFVFKKSTFLARKIIHKTGLARVPARNESWWEHVEPGPPDAIFGVTEAFRADKNPKKVLLGVGAYRTDDGKPFVLNCVRKAEELLIAKKLDHEYLAQSGLAEFKTASALLAFGKDSCIVKEGLNLTVQALSGTGAIRLGAAFLSRFHCGPKVVYLPNPTWPNHIKVFEHCGIKHKFYRHYKPDTIEFDHCGACEDIKKIPEKSIIIFHAIAHNPTGIDPNMEQWKELSQLCLERKLFVFFDMAYQGFASGDAEADAASVRQFVEDGHKIALAQSYAKNMGLYGERIGALTLLATSKDEVERLKTQLDIVIMSMYAIPPLYGARIVTEILTNDVLRVLWLKDIKEMADRIMLARQMLVENLKIAGSQKNWSHITRQIGMFSYTGLTKEQVEKIIKEHGVYMMASGRISVASLGSTNVEYVAQAMHAVTKC